jgi:hypothetical protein
MFDEKSMTYRHGWICKLLILRSAKSISDRLLNCAIYFLASSE